MLFDSLAGRLFAAIIILSMPAGALDMPCFAQNFRASGDRQAADQTQVKKIIGLLASAGKELKDGKPDISAAGVRQASRLLKDLKLSHTSGVYSGIEVSLARSLHMQVARAFAALDDRKSAESEFQNAINIRDVFSDYPDAAEESRAYADFLQKCGRKSEAEKMAGRSRCIAKLNAFRDKFGQDGEAYLAEKLAEEAVKEASSPLEQRDLIFSAMRKLARAYEFQKKYERAGQCHRRRLEMARQYKNEMQTAEALLDLGMLAEEENKRSEAEKHYRDAIGHFKACGKNSDSYAQQRLTLLLEKPELGKSPAKAGQK